MYMVFRNSHQEDICSARASSIPNKVETVSIYNTIPTRRGPMIALAAPCKRDILLSGQQASSLNVLSQIEIPKFPLKCF